MTDRRIQAIEEERMERVWATMLREHVNKGLTLREVFCAGWLNALAYHELIAVPLSGLPADSDQPYLLPVSTLEPRP